MGNPKRIPVEAIQAMKKTLDALPDKNLDKAKEEALPMLNSQIRKAYAKGYSVKELAAILSEGNVAVSAPTLTGKSGRGYALFRQNANLESRGRPPHRQQGGIVTLAVAVRCNV